MRYHGRRLADFASPGQQIGCAWSVQTACMVSLAGVGDGDGPVATARARSVEGDRNRQDGIVWTNTVRVETRNAVGVYAT